MVELTHWIRQLPVGDIIGGLLGLAFFLNLPLGWLRKGVRKLSAPWFIYIHLSIPIIVALRIWSGMHYHGWYWLLLPAMIGAAIFGQVMGGRLRP